MRVCKACGTHNENKEYLLIHCSMFTRVRQRFPEFAFASLHDIMNSVDQYKVAKYISGCLAATFQPGQPCVCVHACVCAFVRACLRASVRLCVRACARARKGACVLWFCIGQIRAHSSFIGLFPVVSAVRPCGRWTNKATSLGRQRHIG